MKINNPKALFLSVLTGFTLFVSHANITAQNNFEKHNNSIVLAKSEIVNSKDITLENQDPGKLTYQSDIIHIDKKNKLINLDGDVEIKIHGFVLTSDKTTIKSLDESEKSKNKKYVYIADSINIDKEKNTLTLNGNVQIKFDNYLITSNKIKITSNNIGETSLSLKDGSKIIHTNT